MTDGGTWQPPEPGPTAPTGPGGLPAPAAGSGFGPPTAPQSVPVEPTGGRGRSRGTAIAAAVGAVAIVGAGIFAITRISGDSSAGGADSPEAAANALLDAIDDQDVLGAVDVLLPGERDTFRQPLEDAVGELTRLEVLSDDADLSDLSGVDLTVTDRDVQVEPTNVDDIANVTISASVAASVDGEQLPIGDWIRDHVDDEQIAELDEDLPAEPGAFPMTAVRKDGRWYLSLFYTAAEQARQRAGEEEVPAEGVALNGGDSPEEAMNAFLQAVADLDLAAIIGSLNPNEFEALQRYAPLFLDDAQSELSAQSVTIDVGDTAYTVSGDGDSRSVDISGLSFTITGDGETAELALADGCWTASVNGGDEVDTCAGDSAATLDQIPDIGEVFTDMQPIEDLADALQQTFADYENPGFIVKQVDGSWYLSPLATVSDQLFAVVGALSRQEIEDLQGKVTDVIESVDEDVSIGLPGLSDPPDRVDLSPDDTLVPDDTIGGEPSDSTPSDSTPTGTADPSEQCYYEDDAADATACFTALVDSGTIDPVEVPWFLRHPECGAADVAWSGDYYALADAEFVALVDQLAPCFQDLVESGEVQDYELPPELLHPECLEGRNWYTVDDEAYSSVFEACAFG